VKKMNGRTGSVEIGEMGVASNTSGTRVNTATLAEIKKREPVNVP